MERHDIDWLERTTTAASSKSRLFDRNREPVLLVARVAWKRLPSHLRSPIRPASPHLRSPFDPVRPGGGQSGGQHYRAREGIRTRFDVTRELKQLAHLQ
jgi:hypothetical protein